MRRIDVRLLFAAVLAGPLLALPSSAQVDPVTLTASAGVGGFVDPTGPVPVEVTVSSEVLFVGVLEVVQEGTTVRLRVEVPAGGEKVYEVAVPPPLEGRQARVRLLPEGGEEPVATTALSMRTPGEELVVGVASWPEAERVLGGVRTQIDGLPVLPVAADPSRSLDPLRYLAAGEVPEDSSPVWDWVERGGRLLLAGEPPAGMDPIGTFPGTPSHWYRLGEGEVLVLADPADPIEWSAVLRPTPLVLGARDFWQTPERPLADAAANGGDQRVPSLPWLFGAILGYAVLVGPVNFLVLRRAGRRDLAWVTVPLLGFLAMGGFWLAGRERLQGVVVNHASVLVGGDVSVARSGLVLATGTSGEHELAFPDGWVVYPSQVGEAVDQFGRPVRAAAGEVAGSSITYELPQLGFAGAQALYSPSQLPRVSLLEGGEALEVGVETDTGMAFWAWGVAGAGGIRVAGTPLAPGADGSLPLGGNRAGEGMANIGDAVVQARQLWNDERSWRVLYPLGEAAGFLLDGATPAFFFGYTEDYRLEVELDGRPRPVEGSSLVVVPLGSEDELTARMGRAPARLVSAGDAGFIDRGPGFLFVHTDRIVVSFDLPPGVEAHPELAWTNLFGDRPGGFEAWDWTAGEFVPVQLGDALDLARHGLPTGEVVVRVSSANPAGEEFVDAPLSPASVELRWEP